MSSKSNTEVIIGGKVYTLSGYEGEEYLQRVAAYINNKINEFNEMEEIRRFPVDMKATLVELNIADDYFKAKDRVEKLEQDLEIKEKELYDLKHEPVSYTHLSAFGPTQRTLPPRLMIPEVTPCSFK